MMRQPCCQWHGCSNRSSDQPLATQQLKHSAIPVSTLAIALALQLLLERTQRLIDIVSLTMICMGGEASNKLRWVRRQWQCLYGGGAAKPNRDVWRMYLGFRDRCGMIGWVSD